MQKNAKQFLILTLLISICSVSLFLHIQKKEQQRIVVCLDAGHGGYDVGAQADDGTNEKDLTLAYTEEIGKYLYRYDPHIRIIYTRQSDNVPWPSNVSQDLAYRVAYAKLHGADYYLSIHFNTAAKSSAYGYTAYIKSTDTRSDAIYKNIVENLNAADWHYDRGIETTANKPLYVVDRLDIPSMLMEVGFLTNPNELKDLKKTSNQTRICKAVAKGYADYLSQTEQKKK